MSQEKKEYDYMFKVILIGMSAVGKSNILIRYTKDQFATDWQSTLGVQFAAKTVKTQQGTNIKLQIWDTAGQQKYRSLMKTFYKGASAAIIVYDITREQTFNNLDKEMQIMKEYCKKDVITMVVGNKSDLEEERTVSKQRGLDFAESRQVAFYEVSAKDGSNVTLIFQKIAQELEKAVISMNVVTEQVSSPYKYQSTTAKKTSESIILDSKKEEIVHQSKQKKKCCQ